MGLSVPAAGRSQAKPRSSKNCRVVANSAGWPTFPDGRSPPPSHALQLLDDQTIDGHTPTVFDVAARDGLPISNDGQGFESRREYRRLPGWSRSRYSRIWDGSGSANRIATCTNSTPRCDQPLQVLQQHLQSIRPQRVILKSTLNSRRGTAEAHKSRLSQGSACIHRIHGSAIPARNTPVTATYGWQRLVGSVLEARGRYDDTQPGGIPSSVLHGSHDPVGTDL